MTLRTLPRHAKLTAPNQGTPIESRPNPGINAASETTSANSEKTSVLAEMIFAGTEATFGAAEVIFSSTEIASGTVKRVIPGTEIVSTGRVRASSLTKRPAAAATLTVACVGIFGFRPNVSTAQPVANPFTVLQYSAAQSPVSLAFRSDGTMYYGRDSAAHGGSHEQNLRIGRVFPDGAFNDLYGESSIIDPDSVIVDEIGMVTGIAGAVLVGHNQGGPSPTAIVTAIRPDTFLQDIFAFPAGDVSDMDFDSTGRLLLVTSRMGVCVATSPAAQPQTFIQLPGGVEPYSLAIASDDRIFTADRNGVIRIHSSSGVLLNGNFASFNGVGGMRFGRGGPFRNDLWVMESGTGMLYRVPASGIRRLVGTGFEAGSYVTNGLRFGTDRALYIAQVGPQVIYRIACVPDRCIADQDDGTGTGTPDCGVTIDDLLYYLRIFEEGAIAADVDDGSGTGTPDGGITIDDLLYYLVRFEAGC